MMKNWCHVSKDPLEKKRPKIVFFFHSLLILRFIYVQTKMWKHAHKLCIFSLLNLFFRYFCLFYRPYCTQTISLDRYLSSFAWFLTVSLFLSIKIWLCYNKLYLSVWYYSTSILQPLYFFIFNLKYSDLNYLFFFYR